MSTEFILTTLQASEVLNQSPRTLEKWRWKLVGPPFHSFGGSVRYLQSELMAWVASTKVDPAQIRRDAGLAEE